VSDKTPTEQTATTANSRDPARVTHLSLQADPEIITLIQMADKYLETIGYTDHGMAHIGRVSQNAWRILAELGLPERDCELAATSSAICSTASATPNPRR
jgi:metal-dependent HD superfamily phosphatase/phosphodiesterase